MRGRIATLAWALGTVAAGGALAAVGAYATDHQAESPTLYVAIGLGVRELAKILDRRDPTRKLS